MNTKECPRGPLEPIVRLTPEQAQQLLQALRDDQDDRVRRELNAELAGRDPRRLIYHRAHWFQSLALQFWTGAGEPAPSRDLVLWIEDGQPPHLAVWAA